MALKMPYETETFTAYSGDVRTTTLALAVWLIDEYTKGQPVGWIKVTLKEGNRKTVKNVSGYYCFTDLSGGNYTVKIESAFYFPVEELIAIPRPEPKNPVNEIVLTPHSGYPFPTHATLIRGIVLSHSNPIVKAAVKVKDKNIETFTDENGEFVLFCKEINKEHISVEISGKTEIVNKTEKGNPIFVEEGKTVSIGKITFP